MKMKATEFFMRRPVLFWSLMTVSSLSYKCRNWKIPPFR